MRILKMSQMNQGCLVSLSTAAVAATLYWHTENCLIPHHHCVLLPVLSPYSCCFGQELKIASSCGTSGHACDGGRRWKSHFERAGAQRVWTEVEVI